MYSQVDRQNPTGLGCLDGYAESLATTGIRGDSAPIEYPRVGDRDAETADLTGRGTTPARDGGAPPQGATAGPGAGRDGDAVGGAYPCPIDISRKTQYLQVDTTFPESDSGYRRSVIVAGCRHIECGTADFCMGCVYPSKGHRPDRKEPMPLEDRLRLSRRRSARSIQDLVRASRLDHLLTLSGGKHFATREAALDAFSGYLHDARWGRWFNEIIGNGYLVIAEPFEDEIGWHLHAAIRGALRKPHLNKLKVTWTAYLYQRLGIARPNTPQRLWRVHIAGPGKNRSPKALGRYLAKYITKSFNASDSLGERRYRCGQGLTRPTVTRTVLTLSETEARLLFIECGRYFEILTADGRHIGWTGEYSPRSDRGSPPKTAAA